MIHLFHKWGTWQKVRHLRVYWDEEYTGMKTEFVRYCSVCKKPETKRVKGMV